MAGSQDFTPDARNAGAAVYLNGRMVARSRAKVSIFDGGFVVGDGVWEGLRLHKGALMFLGRHLERLYWGAEKIGLDIGLTRDELTAEIWKLLDHNGMSDGAHLRVMITRGAKAAANQDPRNALGGPTIAITAEYKQPSEEIMRQGIALHTSAIRCSPAEMFDMRLNSHSRLNLILALNEAIAAGCDEALMLDPNGFVSSCNATNFFFVRGGAVCTSTGEFCFQGVTRENAIRLCEENGIELRVGRFSIQNARDADEAFVTGTFGGLTPVREIDGVTLRAGAPGPVTRRLSGLYAAAKDAYAKAHAR